MHIKKLLPLLLLLGAANGWLFSATTCTIVDNQPTYGYQVLAGSQRQIVIYQTGCPTVTGTGMSFVQATHTLTIAGTFGVDFVVGRSVQLSDFSGFPGGLDTYFHEMALGAEMVILANHGTSLDVSFSRPGRTDFGFIPGTVTVTEYSRVTFTSTTTAGSASATFDGLSSKTTIPTTLVKVSNTPGSCSAGPASPSGSYVMTSSQIVTVVATLADDATKTTSIPMRVCANTTKVIIPGEHYHQLFIGQELLLNSFVFGNTDQRVTWSASCGTITTDTTKRNIVFKDTTGSRRCTVTATSVADGTKTDAWTVYTSPNALPSWYNTRPEKAEPQECYVDPAFTGTDIEIGPSKAHTTINGSGYNTAGWNLMRIWNEDVTGTSPTTYHEILQFQHGGTSGTSPAHVCGVPDSTGHYPVIDADQATPPPWILAPFFYGVGVVMVSENGCHGKFQDTNCGGNYFGIHGLKIINGDQGHQYYQLDGLLYDWVAPDAIRFQQGYGMSATGNAMNNDAQGVATYETSNNAYYGQMSHAVMVDGNYINRSGVTGDSAGLLHAMYIQNFNGVAITRNVIDPQIGAGSCMKFRGPGVIAAFNRCAGGFAYTFDVIENQDASAFVDFNQYLGPPGDASCGFAYCGGDLAGMDRIAAYQEMNFWGSFFFGNVSAGGHSHCNDDHYAAAGGNIDITARYGGCFDFYNTFADVADSARWKIGTDVTGGGDKWYMNPNFYIANTITWSVVDTNVVITDNANSFGKLQTNLFRTGILDLSLPIYGSLLNTGEFNTGFGNRAETYDMPYTAAVSPHFAMNTASDFIQTSTLPFNTSTYVPPGGSAAIGAASSLTGEAANFNILYNAVNANGTINARTTTADIGAMESGLAPSPVSIALTPNPINVTTTGTVTLTCTTTLSDSSTRNCISPALTSSDATKATVSGLVVTGVTVGSGFVYAVAESLTSPNDNFTVTLPAIAQSFKGALKVRGKVH
jgi:hypothetical protein